MLDFCNPVKLRPFLMIGYPDEFFAEVGEQFRSLLGYMSPENIKKTSEVKYSEKKNEPITDLSTNTKNEPNCGIYCSDCDIWFSGTKEYNFHKFDDNHRLKAGLILTIFEIFNFMFFIIQIVIWFKLLNNFFRLRSLSMSNLFKNI